MALSVLLPILVSVCERPKLARGACLGQGQAHSRVHICWDCFWKEKMADAGASTDLSTSQMSQGSNGVLQAKLARRKLQVRSPGTLTPLVFFVAAAPLFLLSSAAL